MRKFSWKDFFTFSKFGWVTLGLTLLLGVMLEVEIFYFLPYFDLRYPTFFGWFSALYFLVVVICTYIGHTYDIAELKSEVLSTLFFFLTPLVGVYFKHKGLKYYDYAWWGFCFIDHLLIVSFLELSLERIHSWKLRKKRYEKVLALMQTRKVYDPRIEKYLQLACDRSIVDKLKKDFEINSTMEALEEKKDGTN